MAHTYILTHMIINEWFSEVGSGGDLGLCLSLNIVIRSLRHDSAVKTIGCSSPTSVRTDLNQSNVQMVPLQTGGSGYWREKSRYSLGDQESVLSAERDGENPCALPTHRQH